MADSQPSMHEKLAALRSQYAERIDARVDDLCDLLDVFGDANESKRRDILQKLREATHKLAGSGATFGFPGVTEHARAMEHSCVDALNGDDNIEVGLVDRLRAMSDQLRKATETQSTETQSEAEKFSTQQDGTSVGREDNPHLHDSSRQDILIVMEYSAEQERQTRLELAHFGFNVRIVDHPQKMIADLKAHGGVDIIITGVHFDDSEDAAFKALGELREHSEFCTIPVVVYSEIDTMTSRLGAVRADVKAYIVKPVDMADLVNVMDDVTERHEEEQFRVLVVDDDESLAQHTEIVLQSAGMETRIATDPMQIYEVLDDFSPELILLDLYMPGCSGQEIAAIVRQREEYAGIPIVFLSGESDKDKQLSAMELGGDDFLTKPIRASHLISSVRIRVARFRKLRSFMVRDSMTGLFNHTTTKQLLDNEISRAQRAKGSLALVALDIDHFKNVNDTYGHAVGDRVIKALARLLRQRLRSADIIGRMGGEEFAAVLPDSGVNEAGRVFDQIRKAFSEIMFHTGDKSFNVTISCGVADFPRYDSATELSDAADKALYAAKHGGRNQVVKAQ
ncbi:MAG: diguanylate cyclase [Magnetovibrio sp.]|nr:diguanylate cyclase [Magnetovibrio sp.]